MKVYVVWQGEYESAWPVLFQTSEAAADFARRRLREKHAACVAEYQEHRRVPSRWIAPHKVGVATTALDEWVERGMKSAVEVMDVFGTADAAEAPSA